MYASKVSLKEENVEYLYCYYIFNKEEYKERGEYSTPIVNDLTDNYLEFKELILNMFEYLLNSNYIIR